VRHVDWGIVKCLVIAGPGFAKESFRWVGGSAAPGGVEGVVGWLRICRCMWWWWICGCMCGSWGVPRGWGLFAPHRSAAQRRLLSLDHPVLNRHALQCNQQPVQRQRLCPSPPLPLPPTLHTRAHATVADQSLRWSGGGAQRRAATHREQNSHCGGTGDARYSFACLSACLCCSHVALHLFVTSYFFCLSPAYFFWGEAASLNFSIRPTWPPHQTKHQTKHQTSPHQPPHHPNPPSTPPH